MSLYTDAANAISNSEKAGGSLKSRIYSGKSWHHPPHQIYALVSETIKWSPVLKEVIEKSDILKVEKKLNPVLATLLVHDFLLSRRGINTSPNHPLHSAVLRHKNRLNAEFTKIRIRKGFSSLEAFRQHINEGDSDGETPSSTRHPRWVRVNTLKTTLEAQMKSTFASYEQRFSLRDIIGSNRDARVLLRDETIDNLLALPPGHNLSRLEAYQRGELIVQDKASCFPACLLDPASTAGDVIDACAAPGNKTTHVAMLQSANKGRRVFAFEKDKHRSVTLQKMVSQAGASVTVHGSTDFLTTNPAEFESVTAILLDPSCSGSGIVGRDDGLKLELPAFGNQDGASRKRKRDDAKEEPPNLEEEAELKKRLESLSAFQSKLLRHAMSFPSVTRIVYSTCSVHKEENEFVVIKALSREKNWRLMKREEQVEGLRKWPVRGDETASEEGLNFLDVHDGMPSPREIADGCIRCEKSSHNGTIGFFVVGFVRENGSPGGTSDDEWEGFSND